MAFEPLTTDTCRVSADFEWLGVSRAGKRMTAKSHHEWVLAETGERFLRMKEAKVAAVEPFREIG